MQRDNESRPHRSNPYFIRHVSLYLGKEVHEDIGSSFAGSYPNFHWRKVNYFEKICSRKTYIEWETSRVSKLNSILSDDRGSRSKRNVPFNCLWYKAYRRMPRITLITVMRIVLPPLDNLIRIGPRVKSVHHSDTCSAIARTPVCHFVPVRSTNVKIEVDRFHELTQIALVHCSIILSN